ncbi:MAG: endonuclease domain-containing protein [Prevotella sp.]|nr:endonuclease domain-containing protein [Prevotella sp.]
MPNKTDDYGNKLLARDLRRCSTAPETVLWQHLRRNALGVKFRRQHPLGPYVLDFFCYELNLCIELDGESHNHHIAEEHDKIRTKYLNEKGITVLRYSNDVVYYHVWAILETIEHFKENPVFMPGWHINERL